MLPDACYAIDQALVGYSQFVHPFVLRPIRPGALAPPHLSELQWVNRSDRDRILRQHDARRRVALLRTRRIEEFHLVLFGDHAVLEPFASLGARGIGDSNGG